MAIDLQCYSRWISRADVPLRIYLLTRTMMND